MPETLDPTTRTKQDLVYELVEQHLQDHRDTLLLAIHYEPKQISRDFFLFEVFQNFGEIDEDRELCEISFSSTLWSELEHDQRMHLILTSREEIKLAIEERWVSLEAVSEAMQANRAEVIYADGSPVINAIIERLRIG